MKVKPKFKVDQYVVVQDIDFTACQIKRIRPVRYWDGAQRFEYELSRNGWLAEGYLRALTPRECGLE